MKIVYRKPFVEPLTTKEDIERDLQILWTVHRLSYGKFSEPASPKEILEFIEKHVWRRDPPHEIFLEMVDFSVVIYASKQCLTQLRTHRLMTHYQQSTRRKKFSSDGEIELIHPKYTEKKKGEFPTELEIPALSFVPQGIMLYGFAKANMRQWNHLLRLRLFDNSSSEIKEVCRQIVNFFIENSLSGLLHPSLRKFG